MSRRPRMLQQAYTRRFAGDGGTDALRWGSPGAKRKAPRTKPAPKPSPEADAIAGLCHWLDEDEPGK